MAISNLNHTFSKNFGFDTDFTCRGIVNSGATTVAPFAGTTLSMTSTGALATSADPGTTSTPIPKWDCCGTYPDRFPYKPNGGNRGCCDGHTYNTLTLSCCASGNTAALNSC